MTDRGPYKHKKNPTGLIVAAVVVVVAIAGIGFAILRPSADTESDKDEAQAPVPLTFEIEETFSQGAEKTPLSDEQRATVTRAISWFKHTCTNLTELYWPDDVVSARAEYRKVGDDHVREKYGWDVTVYIAITMSRDIVYQGGIRVAGHTLHYNLGGGKMPGIVGQKEVTKWMCGIDRDKYPGDTPGHRAVPELSFIK